MSRSKRDGFPLEILPGAKIQALHPDVAALVTTTIRRKRKAKIGRYAAPGVIYPPGTVIADFVVEGRAVPWSVSIHRGGKCARLVAWQRQVKEAATRAMKGRLPHAGPFSLGVVFQLVRRGVMCDLSNALKGTEDACQGVIFVNDNMCRQTVVSYNPDASIDQTRITVIAL